jgi:hypothetical protein
MSLQKATFQFILEEGQKDVKESGQQLDATFGCQSRYCC